MDHRELLILNETSDFKLDREGVGFLWGTILHYDHDILFSFYY